MEEGQMLQFGALMASREAESKVADFNLEVVVYDSPCDPVGGVATAKRLTTDGAVSAVIGYLCAETLRAVLPLYQDAGLALINPTVSAEYVRQGETRNLFSLPHFSLPMRKRVLASIGLRSSGTTLPMAMYSALHSMRKPHGWIWR
jgi:ABC-type branched-subunit amino acid transport system substrate-binding protein